MYVWMLGGGVKMDRLMVSVNRRISGGLILVTCPHSHPNPFSKHPKDRALKDLLKWSYVNNFSLKCVFCGESNN